MRLGMCVNRVPIINTLSGIANLQKAMLQVEQYDTLVRSGGEAVPSHASNLFRHLGSLEQVLWLGSQHRPKHFALAAEVHGKTTIEGWRSRS